MAKKTSFILWFKQLGIEDVPLVGGKNASLGEMYRKLTKKKVNIPNGFAITAYGYHYFLKKAKIKNEIKRILRGLNKNNKNNLVELQKRGKAVRDTIINAELPADLKKAITKGYDKLCKEYGPDTDVAVRSSATAEDLPDASFAGQQETFLNIKAHDKLLEACKKCFASLFTNRAISYRIDKGFDHFSIGLSIGIQKMVRSDKAASGVMFTIDTDSGFNKVVYVTASYGLGENIVQGAVNPDEWYVFKPTMKIISRSLGEKARKMIYTREKGKTTKNIPTPEQERRKFCLKDEEVMTLANWGMIIEEHYSKKAKKYKPMDIEWAKDGITNKLFIVQARPETVHTNKNMTVLEEYKLEEKNGILCSGRAIGSKIGKGLARVILNVKDINKFNKGEVLVTEMTDPDWQPIMKIASAIVTNKGGATCHAAIVARELGIPCIVGTKEATRVIKQNKPITIDCSQGEEGIVYKGLLKFSIKRTDLKKIPQTKTHIMMNLGNPEEAFMYSFLPNKGIGLARMEFIINESIKIHPNALLQYNQLKDKKVKALIYQLTPGYKNKAQYFVDRLAEGVATIAAAFHPYPVIVRMSDFKTNEYANLIGGKAYEPKEENPMLGWRGASRYYDPNYKEGFALECKAIKKAREEFGLSNIKVMIPFCRTVDEGKKVLAEMHKNDLVQGKNKLEIYAMCEIPSNVILAEEFLKVFDGFSIGSNDLTQLTLGIDRDSELVSHIYDERNDAVKTLIKNVIQIARKKKKYIGICGQAPSNYPEFAEFLVKEGIDSISLNPDSVVKTIIDIAKLEKKLRRK
ncbi:phosphoenolpyruvate synthase [Candidatus Woesearchaeota archaeon]|nr:phosphoenolpyruvate synthase [Candidatus Woesearchaeota archaeon]